MLTALNNPVNLVDRDGLWFVFDILSSLYDTYDVCDSWVNRNRTWLDTFFTTGCATAGVLLPGNGQTYKMAAVEAGGLAGVGMGQGQRYSEMALE